MGKQIIYEINLFYLNKLMVREDTSKLLWDYIFKIPFLLTGPAPVHMVNIA